MNNHLTASHNLVVILDGGSSTFVSTVNAASDYFIDHAQQSSLPAG
jgi:hypothetical protein